MKPLDQLRRLQAIKALHVARDRGRLAAAARTERKRQEVADQATRDKRLAEREAESLIDCGLRQATPGTITPGFYKGLVFQAAAAHHTAALLGQWADHRRTQHKESVAHRQSTAAALVAAEARADRFKDVVRSKAAAERRRAEIRAEDASSEHAARRDHHG